MKSYLTKVTSGAAGVGIVLLGCIMAGLGLSLMVMLAIFAVAVIGLGILAAPLLALIQGSDRKDAKPVAA